MTIHFVFLAIIYILTLAYRKLRDNNKKNAKFLLLIVFTLLVCFLGLRDISIGTDTYNYVYIFRSNMFQYSNLEIMLPIIIKIINMLTSKYYVYLLTLAFICIYGIYKSAKEYDFDTEYFIFLYITSFCFLYSTSAIRFFCAFSIILISFKYMIKQDTKKVLLLLLLACLFHTTAIVFIPLYFITKFKFSKKKYYLFLTILTFAVLFEKIIGFDFIFNIGLFEKYKYVVETQNEVGGLSIIMNFGIIIFSLIYYNSIVSYKEDYEFYLKMHAISTTIDFIGIAYRVVWYFRFPVWFILPIILKNLKNKNKQDYHLIYFIFMIIYILMYYYLLKNSFSTHNLLNYIFNNYLK